MRLLRITLVLLVLLAAATASAQERTLRWKSLDVTARLEASGMLRVVERHAMLFDGAWNGGERVFNVRPGQNLELISLRRVDPDSGKSEEFRVGPLSEVGRFGWSGSALRWRTREPYDPPYREAMLIFEIEYAMSGVVFRDGANYRLDHDFAFPDRPAPIERYSLKVEIDPVWKSDPLPPLERDNIPPGESVVLHLPLVHTGEGEPQHINRPPPPPKPEPPPPPPLEMPSPLRGAAVAAFLLLFAGLVVAFWRHDRSVGRFEEWDHIAPEGAEWLQKNVFAYPPEVIGAAWDETSSDAEVSALLARLIQEKKIEAERTAINERTSIPRLTLKVPRQSLQDHERALVDALFVKGDTTDRPTIRSHYRSSGFSPASVLRVPLMRRVDAITARAFGAKRTASRRAGGWIVALLFLTMIAALFTPPGVALALFTFPILAATCLGLSLIVASWYRSKVSGAGAALMVIGALLPMVFVVTMLRHPAAFAVAAIEAVAVTWYALRKARWHGTPELLAWRRNLVAARDWFAAELSKPEPQLRDEWMPYLIAFGLSEALDDWTRSFGAQRAEGSPARRGDTLPPVPMVIVASKAEPAFTGGGGSFGGAGATGGWATEIASIASAVPPPALSSSGGGSSSSWSGSSSSSSSSFSSSSSSSRSGGGGGGGW